MPGRCSQTRDLQQILVQSAGTDESHLDYYVIVAVLYLLVPWVCDGFVFVSTVGYYCVCSFMC